MGLNEITSLIALVLMVLVFRGYWPLVETHGQSWAALTIKGLVLVVAATGLRSFYWDGVQAVSGDNWFTIRDALGGQQFSAVFNVLVIWACYYFLKGRLHLIPMDERHEWRWWTAWAYPAKKCLIDWRFK